jgi:hypothetical protein
MMETQHSSFSSIWDADRVDGAGESGWGMLIAHASGRCQRVHSSLRSRRSFILLRDEGLPSDCVFLKLSEHIKLSEH